jgi:hypothetical protein
MRRVAPGAVVAALLVTAAVGVNAGGAGQRAASSDPLTLRFVSEDRVYPQQLANTPNEVREYVGQITNQESGDYRAVCTGLGLFTNDHTLDCSIVLRMGGGSVIVQGLVASPEGGDELLGQSAGHLAVTGGTHSYNGKRGYLDLMSPTAASLSLQ